MPQYLNITPVSAEHDVTGGPGLHLLLMCFSPDIVECPAPMNWTPGSWAGRHSLTSTVRFNGQRIVLDGHDQGPLLSHGPFVDPWRSLKSNRKTSYSASQVLANGKPIACVDESHPMMTCGDPISLPSGFNFVNAGHNLMIGMSELDELKGTVAIVCSVITDIIMFVASPPTGPADSKFFSDTNFGQDLFGVDPKKLLVGAGVNLVGSVVVSAATGWKEPIVFKAEQGNGFVAIQHEIQYDPVEGKLSHKGTSNAVGAGRNEYADSTPKPDPIKNPSYTPDVSWGDRL